MDGSKDNDIESFWGFFRSNAERFAPDNLHEPAIAELESRLFRLGVCDWEIGPGLVAPNMFVISPGDDLALLTRTREIVEKAPAVAGWEFHSSKPKRKWKLRFQFADGILVEGARWEVIVLPLGNHKYDLLLRPPADCALFQDDLDIAASIIVQGELGEAKKLEKVNSIKVVENWNKTELSVARKLETNLLDQVIT